MRTFYLDGEAVVLSNGRLYYLNPSASFVWACLEDDMTAESIADELASTFRIEVAHALADVNGLISRWRCEGLVDVRDAALEPKTDGATPTPRMPTPSSFRPAAEHTYRLLNSVFKVRLQSPTLERWVHPLLAHLEATGCEPDHVVNVFSADEAIHVTMDGRSVGLCAATEEVAPLVNVEMLLLAYPAAGGLAAFHAGAVGVGGRCVLLPGQSGSGKSTLTAGLVSAGFRHLSDELGLLMPDSHAVRPVPVCLSIKEGSWKVLSERCAGLENLPVHRRLDGRLVRYLPPPVDVGGTGTLPVACVVFPHYIEGAPARMEPVTTAQALCRISEAGYDLIDLSNADIVTELIGWLAETATFSLAYGDLDEAIRLIGELVGE